MRDTADQEQLKLHICNPEMHNAETAIVWNYCWILATAKNIKNYDFFSK